METIRVFGPQSEVLEMRERLQEHPEFEEAISDVVTEPRNPLDPAPLGMEPWVYFLIHTSAHLSVEVIKATYAHYANKRTGHLKIEVSDKN